MLVESYVRAKFGSAASLAVAVFKAESGLNPTSTNANNRDGSIDRGVAQINSIHCERVEKMYGEDCADALYTPKINIDYAYVKYTEEGFKPWVAYKNGSYKKYVQ